MADNSVLDSKDMKILELVTEDGKLPLKKIAATVRLSREAVAYRLKRLEQLNILRNCVAKIDMTRFYQSSYLILFRFFSRLSPESQEKRIKFLMSSPYVMWVASLSGEYDIAASFLTRDTSDLLNFISSIEKEFTGGLKYDLLTYSKEIKNSFKDVFSTTKQLPKPSEGFIMESFSPAQFVDLDDTSKLLLYALSKNAKMTNAELSKLTNLSEEGVRQRIKNLENKSLITGYRYLVNIYNMDMEIYHILLRFQNMTDEKENEMRMYIQTNPNFYYAARLIGNYHLTICITARDRFHFQEIVNELRSRFSDNIARLRTQTIFGEYKHTYLPPACCRDIKGFDKIEKEFEEKYEFFHDAKSAAKQS
jgi:DNA-binding Lrp family transcriptional regulator